MERASGGDEEEALQRVVISEGFQEEMRFHLGSLKDVWCQGGAVPAPGLCSF